MKRLIAIAALALMGGCTAVQSSLTDAKDTILNPPSQVWEAIKYILQFAIDLFAGFFSDVVGKFGL